VHDIVGLTVEAEDGRRLGQIQEVLRTGANDVYVVAGPLGELLIPAIADVVQSIDLEAGRVVVRPLPGLLPGDD
jgi:16S rRNA processing protein RimM